MKNVLLIHLGISGLITKEDPEYILEQSLNAEN